MPLISVPALYDGTSVQLLEQVSVNEPYRVLVTFVEPVRTGATPSELERFWASFGAWQDQEPIETTVQKLRQDRRSKAEPPSL